MLACRAAVAGLPQYSHSILLLGGTDSGTRAARFGLEFVDRLAPPLGDPALASPGVRRYLAMRGRYDIVQCWGTNFRKLVQRAGLGSMFVCEFDFETGGWAPAGRVVDVPAWRSLPAHRAAARSRDNAGIHTRRMIRESIGLNDDDIALVMVADPPSDGDAIRFAYLLSLLGVAGKPAVGILSRSSRRTRLAKDAQRVRHMHKPLIIVDEPLASVLPACDLGVFSVGSRFGEPGESFTFANKTLLGCAHAHGIPVVTACAAAATCSHCIAPTPHPTRLARVISRLIVDQSALRDSRAAAVSSDANESRARFVDSIRAGWIHARMGRTAESEPSEVTA